MKDYVDQRNGGYWVSGSRVSLDSVVYAFREGQSPESIAQSFPVLELEQVYGAITYYLAHQLEIDAYLVKAEQDYFAARLAERQADPEFYEKLAQARRSQVGAE